MTRGGLACAVVVLATASYAEVANAAKPSQKASAPSQGPTAEQLAEQAFKAYEAKDFAGAIGVYMKSFQISGDARILYNIASIYDKKLHDRVLAEDFYRRYLKSTTTEPELVKKVNDRLQELKNEQDTLSDNSDAKSAPEPSNQDKPQASPPPAQRESQFPWATVGLGVGAVGLVSLGVGSFFGLSALSKSRDVNDQCPGGTCASSRGVALRDDASTDATLSTIFMIAGGVLTAGGAAMFFLAPKGASPSPKTGLRIQPTVDFARGGVSLSGSF